MYETHPQYEFLMSALWESIRKSDIVTFYSIIDKLRQLKIEIDQNKE